jgi:ATP synthase F1 gamma subunit
MTKELKARVRTLKSTHKITSAMKIVAATTFNKLKHSMIAKFDFLESLSALSTQMQIRPSNANRRRLLIVVGGDRGLCGGYNTVIRKKAIQYLKDFPDAEIAFIGTKIILKEYKGIFTDTVQNLREWTVLLDKLQPIWEQYGTVDVVYTFFHSLYDQQVKLASVYSSNEPPIQSFSPIENDNVIILNETTVDISPLIYTATVMQAIVHAQLCEFSTRMLSMDNATQNAEKMIQRLSLEINKMRQAMITKELSETVGCLLNK